MEHITRRYNFEFKTRPGNSTPRIDRIAEKSATENKFSKNADFTKRRLE